MADAGGVLRALFVVAPGHGHFYSLAPVALGFHGRGHQVRVATSPSFCPVVAASGLSPVPAGMDWLESDLDRFFPQFAGLGPARRGEALGRIFNYFWPRSMTPDLRALVAAWRPDVVVIEPGAIAGQLAAELHGLPLALAQHTIPTPIMPATMPADEAGLLRVREAMVGPLSRVNLRRQLGLAEGESEPWLVLDMVPPSLHLLAAGYVRRNAHPVRPAAYDPPADDPAGWAWLGSLPRDRPTIHVSLGTVFHRAPAVLRAVVQGLSEIRANLVVALGDVPAAELGPSPPHARLVRWAPHDRLLPRCDLFVAHGGIGGVIKSLACGVPLLVLPQAVDQFVNALRLRSTGAGRLLDPVDVTPDAVAREARCLLENPLHRLSALRLRDEIEAMPPLEHGLDLLERLARERRPLEAERRPPLLM